MFCTTFYLWSINRSFVLEWKPFSGQCSCSWGKPRIINISDHSIFVVTHHKRIDDFILLIDLISIYSLLRNFISFFIIIAQRDDESSVTEREKSGTNRSKRPGKKFARNCVVLVCKMNSRRFFNI